MIEIKSNYVINLSQWKQTQLIKKLSITVDKNKKISAIGYFQETYLKQIQKTWK